MSRPKVGYTVNRKIKSAQKSIKHLSTILKIAQEAKEEDLIAKLTARVKFWEEYIVKITPVKELKKSKK